jgi:hypothetical protein
MRASRQALGTARKANRRNKQFVKKLHDQFLQQAKGGRKQTSPVNMLLSGGMRESFKVVVSPNIVRGLMLSFSYTNKLADIHNRRGAGKSKVVRRILPTRSGERFNRRIEAVIFEQLQKATDIVAKKINRQ